MTLVALVERAEKRATEDNGKALGEGLLPCFEVDRHLRHVLHAEVCRLLVGRAVGLHGEDLLVKRPGRLGADSEVAQALHGQLDHAPLVLVSVSVPPAGVVVNKEAADIKLGIGEPLDPVFVGTCHGVGHAGTRLALILDFGHEAAQVHLGRKGRTLDELSGCVLHRVRRSFHGLVAGGHVNGSALVGALDGVAALILGHGFCGCLLSASELARCCRGARHLSARQGAQGNSWLPGFIEA